MLSWGDFELGQPSFASIDVSFISLSLILPALHRILAEGGQVVALVKPQFEAGREQIGKNGIVKDKSVHLKVLEEVTKMAVETGFSVKALSFSPVQGGHGNIEFLAHLEKSTQPNQIDKEVITTTVYQAHEEFKRMNKRERLEVIKDLVVRFPIDTQEEIVERLEAMGVNATQATVSRDIKELGIIKVPSADKGYIYGLPKAGLVKVKSQNVFEVSVMDKMINLRLVPGSSAVVKRQILEQFQEHVFSVIADDDSILLIVTNEGIISQIEQTVRGW